MKKLSLILVLMLAITLLVGCSSSSSTETSQYQLQIEVEGEGTVSPAVGKHSYEKSKTVQLEATAKDGWQFERWKGSIDSSQNQTEIVVDGDLTAIAVFSEEGSSSSLTITEQKNYIDLTDTSVKFLFKTETTNQVNLYLGTSKDELNKVKDQISYDNQGLKVDDLTPGEKYYYQIEVINGDEKSSTDILSFNKLAETNDWQPAEWAKDAVFYEVFVRSFYDGNGDGIGDFVGLKEKIPYFKELGVDALWLMPINKSPTYHAYDVADYYTTDPDYGTKEEFREFLEAAHANGLKVIMDLVVNHSSTQHQWFENAAQGEDSEYRDYYIWEDKFTDLDEDGPWGQNVWHNASAPDHYYGIFWDQMPDLNLRNPKVRNETKEIAEYWLDPNNDGDFSDGVDGYRLDAALHIDDKDPQVTHNYWQEFNTAVKDVNPDAFLVGENWTKTSTMAKFFEDLDSSFNFDLADDFVAMAQGNNLDLLSIIRDIHQQYSNYSTEYIDSTFLRNHDQTRVATELGGDKSKIKLAASLLLTSPGTPFIYYGEELGQRGDKPDDNIREPFDWYQDAQGPGMTTMDKGGFYHDMKYTEANDGISLEEQEDVTGSIFEHYERLIEIRQDNQALFEQENYTKIDTPPSMYGYKVTTAHDNLYVLHNLSTNNRKITVDNQVTELLSNTDYANEEEITVSDYSTVILGTQSDNLNIELPNLDTVTVTFVVDVPSNTPSDAQLYCASELNSWDPQASNYQLTKRSDGDYEISLEQLSGTSIEFKFTRGSWDSAEVTETRVNEDGFVDDGSGNVNRVYEFNSNNQTKYLEIKEWVDM